MHKRPIFKFGWDALAVLIWTNLMSVLIQLGFVAMSFHTVMSHVYLFSNLSGCLQLAATILICQPTHYLEKVGLFFALLGVIIMIADPDARKDGQPIKLGADLLVLPINFAWFAYFAGAQYIKKRMDFEVIVFLGTSVVFFSSAFLTVFLEGTKFDTSNDGVFGFVQKENAAICFIGNAIICGFWGIHGYVLALFYYPQLFVMNCLLMEPIVSQIIGVMMGNDKCPGWMSFAGAIIVMAAINIMADGEVERVKEQEKETKEPLEVNYEQLKNKENDADVSIPE